MRRVICTRYLTARFLGVDKDCAKKQSENDAKICNELKIKMIEDVTRKLNKERNRDD